MSPTPPAAVDEPFVSLRATAFAALLDGSLTPYAAVDSVRAFEAARPELERCDVYVSTAITSGGFQRNTTDFDAAKQKNEDLAARMLTALLESQVTLTPTNMMIPTELGHVQGWTDIDYLQFYFAYARGLSGSDAAALHDAVIAQSTPEARGVADNRELSNDERWEDYRRVTVVMLEAIDAITRTPRAPVYPALSVMLQLVDTEHSLGCRAEQLFAEHFQLDILAPAVDGRSISHLPVLDRALGDLRGCGVPAFAATTTVVPSPVRLNAAESSV
jgi:hypothetical protein